MVKNGDMDIEVVRERRWGQKLLRRDVEEYWKDQEFQSLRENGVPVV